MLNGMFAIKKDIQRNDVAITKMQTESSVEQLHD